MARPPRDIATERLVSLPLLLYVYATMGLAQAAVCVGAYLWVFTDRGVPLSDVFLIDAKSDTWSVDEDSNDDIVGSYTGEEQAQIVRQVRAFRLLAEIR